MRKYITLIFALALMSLGLNAQSGRGSGLSGKGLDGFIEQTQFDSLHVDPGTFVYGVAGSGQEVTATGIELNYLDISSLGTGASSKAVVLDANGSYTWPAADTLFYGVLHDGTDAITSTAAQLNAIPATTSSAAQLNYVNIASLGTGVNTKAVVLDPSGDYTWEAGGIFTYAILNDGSNAITATAAEINYVDVTPGASAASKAIVLDGSSKIDAIDITTLSIGGTAVKSTAAEVDTRAIVVYMDDVSTGPQVYVVSPYTGNVTAVYSVLNATIATADAEITIKDNAGNTMGALTIASSGSGPGDIDSDLSIDGAHDDVAVGDFIEIETNNASTNAAAVWFTIIIEIQ